VRGELTSRAAGAGCVAIAALGVAADLAKPPTADVGFFLYAAGRLLDGARLYRDVVDINPPLIFAANVPVVQLARATGLSEFLLYGLGSALVVGLLLLYSSRLIVRYVLPGEPARARYLVLLLCFAFFAFPGFDFGEREHFVLALLVPYVMLAAAQWAGREAPAGDRVAAGLLSGAAIALKPSFVLVWLVLGGVRRMRGPRASRWTPTPESAAGLGVLLVYGAAVLWLAPDYLKVVAVLGPAYAAWLREPFYKLLVLGPGIPLVAFALLALGAMRRDVRAPALAAALAWAMVACWAAGAVQEKEFRYHFYPAMGFAFVLLGLLAAGAGTVGQGLAERIFRRTSRALLATIAVVVLASSARDAAGLNPVPRQQAAEIDQMAAEVRKLADGRPVGVFSHTTGSAFPLANYADVELASRFPSFWVIAALYWEAIATGGPLRYRAVSQMAPAERYFLDAVRQDLTAAQPRLIVVLRPGRDAAVNGQRRLNFVAYFDRDPQLAALLARYHFTARIGEYLFYERGEAGPVASGPLPSAVVGTLDVGRARLADLRFGSLDGEWLFGVALFVAAWVALAIGERRRPAL